MEQSKKQEKCFAHAVKLANGNYSYDFDIFGEYKPEEKPGITSAVTPVLAIAKNRRKAQPL
ncbi:MAG: hypothetical protein IPF62_12265 [Bacteroidetes bacterium]|nr:hypothetical protein [Bacteroidota bacterium]